MSFYVLFGGFMHSELKRVPDSQVEARQCVQPRANTFSLEDISSYT